MCESLEIYLLSFEKLMSHSIPLECLIVQGTGFNKAKVCHYFFKDSVRTDGAVFTESIWS